MAAQQQTPEELEKQKKLLELERQVIEERAKLLEAQRALQQANELADAKAAKTVADAEKAAADARKADADAQLAALKAAIGEVPASGIQGAVDTKDKAGVTEAALLAGRAARLAAERIATDLPAPPNTSKILLLYSSADVPNFNALTTYRAQQTLIREALEEADKASAAADQKAPPRQGVVTEVPVAGAIGLGLEAASKILGFFRSDFAIGGVSLSLDDSLLLHALAGNDTLRGKYQVRLPAQYNADALSQPAQTILQDLKTLAILKAGIAPKVEHHDKVKADFLAQASMATEPQKTALQTNATIHEQAAATIKAAIALYDSFFTKLTTVDDKGSTALNAVVREGVVAKTLSSGGSLLVIKLQTSGGAYYTKKNLWTFFGGMPFYNMGGIVASYVLMSGPDGNTLKSGVVPIHGGFVKSNEVQATVER
jgi:hypothetical protein